jgi:DNA primase
MSVINEHPDKNVRKLYAGEVASHVGIPAADLMTLAERGSRRPVVAVAAPDRSSRRENAELRERLERLERLVESRNGR